MGTTLIERFDKKWTPEPNTGCWLWFGVTNHAGYGELRVNKKHIRAHRFSYESHRGTIPAGAVLDHLCRNVSCVNPDHLEPVTQAENMRRGDVRARLLQSRADKTHCKNGHDMLDVQNVRVSGNRRRCRRCAAQSSARQRKRNQP